VLSVLALRTRSWRDARTPLVTVLVFAVLTLVATLLHLDRFHFGAPGLVARSAAWIWLGVYLVVPVALLVVVVRQTRALTAGPTDPARSTALPRWLLGLLGLQGLVLGLTAVGLFLAPSVSGAVVAVDADAADRADDRRLAGRPRGGRAARPPRG
jgi:hypothetical protein